MKGIKDIIVKGSIFAVLSTVFCVGGAGRGLETARANGHFPYRDWDNTEKVLDQECHAVDNTGYWGEPDKETWYVASNFFLAPDIDRRITVSGNVNLILCDDKSLTVPYGIHVSGENSLTIYGQREGTGKLIVTAEENYNGAGIGGDSGETAGRITINGGYIETTGGDGGAGIGGGTFGVGGTVTINGGVVKAHGGRYAAGIGGGEGGAGGTVTINGGVIEATGGEGGAGIGGGNYGAGGTITINGGTVAAAGDGGYGIGGGNGNTNYCSLTLGAAVKLYGRDDTPFDSSPSVIPEDEYIMEPNMSGYDYPYDPGHKYMKAIGSEMIAMIGNVPYNDLKAAVDAANPGDTVTLLRDEEPDSTLTVSKNLILDLNGHTIDGSRIKAESKTVIKILSTGNLTLDDSSEAKIGLITGGSAGVDGGGVYANGDFTMNGGTISGNRAGWNGGGVYVANGTFTMNGGKICSNTAGESGGGVGLCDTNPATFRMNGGSICNNEGGGVFFDKQSDQQPSNSRFILTGGTIRDNRLEDGTIRNVHLGNGKLITILEELKETTSIGVTTDPPPTLGSPVTITSGWKTYMSSKDPSLYFKSDDPGSAPALNANSEAELRVAYTVTVRNGTGDGEYEENDTVTIKADDPPEGKVFDKWMSKDGVTFADAASTKTTFTMPGHDVTVTATYKDKGEKEDNPDPNPGPDKPAQEKTPDKVPVTDPSSSYASPEDNFAPVAPGSSEGTGGSIKKLELDFSKVKGSGVAADDLKMTAIAGSKFITKEKVKDKNSVKTEGGVKAKFNKKNSTVTITCKNSGKAIFNMENGDSYTVNFTVEKPKPNKNEARISAGTAPVTKTVKDLFGTSINGGKLTIVKEKLSGQATLKGNELTVNPAEKDTIKLQYQYLNKKYKLSIKVK